MALVSTPIYTKSPYFIKVDEPQNTGSLIRLYIWRADGVEPVEPTYILSKQIPASNKTEMYYNISGYINEFYNFEFNNPSDTTTNLTANEEEWVFCRVVSLYISETSGGYVEVADDTYRCFYGYGYFEDGYNPDLGIMHLTEGSYNYLPNASATNTLEKMGSVRWIAQTNWSVRYTNLSSGATQTFLISLGSNPVKTTPLVYVVYADDGNKVEFLDDLGATQYTFYMYPVTECKYTPIVCDFVNRYGNWQRMWFFKLSKENINATSQTYNFASRELENYSTYKGQRQSFNSNAIESIKVNTGFVKESFNESIKELLLSETILLDNKPVELKTKAIEYKTGLIDKLINYEFTFDYAYDKINSII